MSNYPTSASEYSLSKPIEQAINRFPRLFDKEHPEELLGRWLKYQVISLNQQLPEDSQDKIQSIYNDLYYCTIKTVNSWIKDQQPRIHETTILKYIAYQDQKYQLTDRERHYILVRRITVRQTEIVSLCRFHKSNDSLYIGVDSFALGKLQWISLILHNLILLFLFQGSMSIIGFIASINGSLGFLSLIIFLFIPLIYAYWIWGDVVKGIRQGDNFLRALRQRFPKRISDNSFDIDDTLIFLKQILPLIINATKQAFEKNGLQIKELEDYLDEISKNIQQQSFSINTGGGNIIGAIFGGRDNKISS
jgi:hypothetical protein